MKVSGLETIGLGDQPHTTWVRIQAEDGLIGLGKIYYVPRAGGAVAVGNLAVNADGHYS